MAELKLDGHAGPGGEPAAEANPFAAGVLESCAIYQRKYSVIKS